MTTRTNERARLGEALRRKFPGGPREALRKLELDESLLDVRRLAFDGANKMPKFVKPNRLQFLLVRGLATAINPLLATDAKVDYSPLVAGLTLKTFTKERRAKIIGDAKKLLKGKTIAKDATMEHVASMLDKLEHVTEPKSLDESVSGPQHRAMEAAAEGHSNLGIPKDVGSEFAHADKGKTFRDALPAYLKDKHKMSDDDIGHIMDMLPENALDADIEQGEEEAEDADVEQEEEEAEDADIEQGAEEAEDDGGETTEIEVNEGQDRRRGGARDRRRGAMDTKKFVTVDAMDKAVAAGIQAERKRNNGLNEARAFVRPFVGELSMALDSAEKIYRAAGNILGIEDADTMPAAALRSVIKHVAPVLQQRQQQQFSGGDDMATDTAGTEGTASRWGEDADRIGSA